VILHTKSITLSYESERVGEVIGISITSNEHRLSVMFLISSVEDENDLDVKVLTFEAMVLDDLLALNELLSK